MSSTNKTEKLQLNQWVLTDPFNMEDFNSDNAKIDAVLGAVPCKKLMDVTLTAAAATVELDLTGIDLSEYATLRVYQRDGTDYMFLRLNNISSSSDCASYSYSQLAWNSTSTYCYGGALCYLDIELANVGVCVHNACRVYKYTFLPAALSTINFVAQPNNSATQYPAGTRFILMGVKK